MFYCNRRHGRELTRPSALPTHRRLLSGFLFAAALISTAGTAHAVECQSEKGAGYPWAWREIDGKRCWYKGNPGMDKKLLRWAESSAAPAAKNAASRNAASKSVASKSASKGATKNASKSESKRSPSIITDYADREELLQTYWPPLPTSGFDDRFGAARANRL